MSGHYLIVEARFYDALAEAQVAGAERALSKAGASWDRISVPGALEIPAAIAFAVEFWSPLPWTSARTSATRGSAFNC